MMNEEKNIPSNETNVIPFPGESGDEMTKEDTSVYGQTSEEVSQNPEGENVAEEEVAQADEDSAHDDDEVTSHDDGDGPSDEEKNSRDFDLFRVMPFVDLMNERTRVKNSKDELASIKSMFDHMGDMSDEAAKAGLIAQMDSASKADIHESIHEFYDTYPVTKHEAERLETLVNSCIALYGDVGRISAAFMMQSMTESLDLRLASMEKVPAEDRTSNHSMLLKRLKTIRDAYANPVDFSMLFNKLAFPANTINLYKAFKKDGPDEAMKFIEKTFANVFNDKFMKSFRHLFREIISPNLDPTYNQGAVDVMIFFMTYWLAAQYEKEYTSGKCAQVRTFVMDVYFMDKYGVQDEIFDLPGGRDYFGTVCYALFMVITATCSDGLTMKTANQEIPDLLDATLKSMKVDYECCITVNPGKTYPGTSIATYFQDDITVDDVLNHSNKEDSDMSNMENQPTSNSVCTDLGQASVDPSIMPDDVDNSDADEDTTTASAGDEPAKVSTPVS